VELIENKADKMAFTGYADGENTILSRRRYKVCKTFTRLRARLNPEARSNLHEAIDSGLVVALHHQEMIKRIQDRFVLLALVLLFALGTGYATELVTQKEISVSHALAGHALVWGTDEPVSGATVELYSSDWKTVLTSTKTDEKGHFSLKPSATGKLFYIRVSAPGMDIYELRVRIDKHATQELTIHLSVAT